MSRHKLVKNLVLNDELDTFDGGLDYDYDSDNENELGKEDLDTQENMRIGTIAVRAELPPYTNYITDQQIQESLWHTYYDIDRTVNYLTRMYPDKSKEASTVGEKNKKGSSFYNFCEFIPKPRSKPPNVRDIQSREKLKHLSFADFFKETPWLNVPFELQATLLPPVTPMGGLLGGSGDPPKMSKLQTLAAARKKMAQERKSTASMATEEPIHLRTSRYAGDSLSSGGQSASPKISRSFPIRRRKPSDAAEQNLDPAKMIKLELEQASPRDCVLIDKAEPSEFANIMFSNSTPEHPRKNFTINFATEDSLTTDPFAGPSPDDVVLAAQSKASSQKTVQSKTKKDKKPKQLIKSIESLTVDEAPKVRSKKLDVLKEFGNQAVKKTANFVVIGHVDAGKSTMMGRLLFDLGLVDQRLIDRYKKEAASMGKSSFAMAWVLDQDSEERARGVTIDIAMKRFETEKTSFTILDAPGHKDFIPNMIAGASQADFAVLVIDASTGSFESGLKGQTREHAFLVRSMGVQRIIITINKLDTVQWSQERFAEIENQISSFLTTAGFQSKNISFVPCSGLTGDNIARKSADPAASWYTGLTLVETLDNFEPVSRALTKPLRLTITDIFHSGAQNSLSVSGHIEAGSLQVSESLIAQPSNHTFFIKSLEYNNEVVDWAVAGQNIVLHLSGNEEQNLKIGGVLCSPSSPIQNINKFTAKVLAFEFLLPMPVDIHKGRLHVTGRVKEILGILNKTTGNDISRKKPRLVKPGMVARVVVELDQVAPLEAPGRIVLRSGGATVATGMLE
ncbi:HBS1-like protein [Podosphaera aphanis]|nr:HBS1-like protein [Podosphaera aphanis]